MKERPGAGDWPHMTLGPALSEPVPWLYKDDRVPPTAEINQDGRAVPTVPFPFFNFLFPVSQIIFKKGKNKSKQTYVSACQTISCNKQKENLIYKASFFFPGS